MSSTTSKGITYPQSTDNFRVWEWLQQLATDADGIIVGSVDVQVFEASGTWTKPAGAIVTLVQVQGAGGGSGGCASTGSGASACSPGASGGEYAQGWYTASSLGSTETVTVGAGGTAGAAGNNAGGTGGTSSFGAHVTAVGGPGSSGSAASTGTNPLGGAGTASGGTGGDWRTPGGSGMPGLTVSSVAIKTNQGGDSFLGRGGQASGTTVGQTNGFSGNSYGGGASGASNGPSQTAAAGSAGADGVVIVTTYTA